MIVTDKNEKLIRQFIRIMISLNISDEAIGMIVAMLPDEMAMTSLVDYLSVHQKATETEIIEEAAKISKISK